jgi:hypothetical protein
MKTENERGEKAFLLVLLCTAMFIYIVSCATILYPAYHFQRISSSNQGIKPQILVQDYSREITKVKWEKFETSTIQKAIAVKPDEQIRINEKKFMKEKGTESKNIERELLRLKLKFYQMKQ